MSRARTIAKLPIIGAIAVFGYRLSIVWRESIGRSFALLRWLLTSNEISNYTYDLTALNKVYMAAFVSEVTGAPHEAIAGYIQELAADTGLQSHIHQVARTSGLTQMADRQVQFGRRLAWYAIARATKPKTIVETGVDKGLGSCVLTAALIRNATEGHEGRYYGLDINPDAGRLLAGRYREFGEIRYGDSLVSLREFVEPIDLFINDSDHSASHEKAEYALVAPRLNSRAIVLADNAHVTTELLAFALASGRRFLFFRETPEQHWYSGAGVGAAFGSRQKG